MINPEHGAPRLEYVLFNQARLGFQAGFKSHLVAFIIKSLTCK
jgi:hypothetical protein